MSRRDYLPDADAPFNAWCQSFTEQIAADPARFGLSAGESAEVESAYAAFAAAWATALNPSTRTSPAVVAKNQARAALERVVRLTVHRVQAYAGLTPPDRTDLGIAPRRPRATRIAAPKTRPVLTMAFSRTGSLPHLRLADEGAPYSGAMPRGVMSAVVFLLTLPEGTRPPVELTEWRFAGLATRPKFQLPGEGRAPAGHALWARAAWVSPRGQLGPASAPFRVTPPVYAALAMAA